MKQIKESLNYKWINYLVFLIGILVTIHIIILIFPIIKPVFLAIYMIICPFLIATCMAYLLNPLVDFFCRLKIKRSYSILITFISIIGTIVYAIFSLIPHLMMSVQDIMDQIPALMVRVEALLESWQFDYMNLYQYDLVVYFLKTQISLKFFQAFYLH